MKVKATTQHKIEKKSYVASYFFLVLFGALGLHRFYLERKGSACAMLGMLIGMIICAIVDNEVANVIGPLLLVGLIAWLIADLFLVPVIVQRHNRKLLRQIEPLTESLFLNKLSDFGEL